MHKVITLSSESETQKFAENLGRLIRGGECFEFISDLGGGKTTFIRYLVAGAGSNDKVSSPSFTISKQYNSPIGTIFHFDFYRLQEAGLVGIELQEALQDSKNVILVEWANSVHDALPKNRIIVELQKVPNSNNSRVCKIIIPSKYKYLAEGIEK